MKKAKRENKHATETKMFFIILIFTFILSIVVAHFIAPEWVDAQQRKMTNPLIVGKMEFFPKAYVAAGQAQGGTGAFVTTATSATIAFTADLGVTTSSVFIVNANDGTPIADDMLTWTATANTLNVFRTVGTTSALSFSYWRVK